MNNNRGNSSHIYHGFQANLNPSPFWRRFLAWCVDYGILGAFSYLYIIVVLVVGGIFFGGLVGLGKLSGGGLDSMSTATAILFFIFLGITILGFLGCYHGYFIYFEHKKGATPGKKLFGLSVVTDDGSPRTMSKMVIRELFRYVDNLFIPAFICMAVTENKQRLGDLVAGTFIAYSKTEEAKNDYLYVKQEDYQYITELVQPAPHIDPAFLDDYLQIASQNFLKGFSEFQMGEPKWQKLEQRVRSHFQKEDHQRLDGRSALLYFAEHCYQIDLKKRREEKG